MAVTVELEPPVALSQGPSSLKVCQETRNTVPISALEAEGSTLDCEIDFHVHH